MALAALFNTPNDPASLALWSFAHAVHHFDMNQQIQKRYGVTMPSFILDPFDPNNSATWEAQHQDLHVAMRQVLNISGFDLSEVNWQIPDSLAAWIQANAAEHIEAAVARVGRPRRTDDPASPGSRPGCT